MSETAMTHALDALFRIWVIGEFEFVSDFGFRVSSFGPLMPGSVPDFGAAMPAYGTLNYSFVKLSASATAVSMALALFTVSMYSPSGVESFTQPPPACT